MKIKTNLLLIVLTVVCIISSCDSEKEECVEAPDTNGQKVKITFEHLEDTLVNLKSKSDLVDLLTREPLIRDFVFRRTEYPNDSAFINEVYNRMTNPYLDTLRSEVTRVFGDFSNLQNQFTEAFTNIAAYYPDFKPPRIQTVISGLDNDLFVSDTLIIVGLDYYLGRGAKFRPKMYEYLLRKYDPDDIVPSCVLLYGIEERFNKSDLSDKTVLADMIAYGKSFYFAKHILPCIADSILISYTPEEIAGSRSNQDLIWSRLIESEVLYSTSHVVKKDYLGERPATIQVGEKCPGRIGQWVGWQIVNKYMETHPDVSLPQLMATRDAQKLFKESRYKPDRR